MHHADGEEDDGTKREEVLNGDTPGASRPGSTLSVALEISSLSHGPDAVARHQGRVVFVPGVAPGDMVEARLVRERASFARAEVVRRLASGAAYRVAPCAWVTECGGCPWQQVAYDVQLAAKATNVREALARIGGLSAAHELPIRRAPDEWRYRHRIRLHVGAGGALGYRRARSHQVVEIGDCVIADAALAAALPAVRALVRRLATRLATVELLGNGTGGVVVSGAAHGAFVAADERHISTLLATAPAPGRIVGVQLATDGWQRTWGDVRVRVDPDAGGTTIVQHPRAFSQVNPAANRLLVETVCTMAAPARRVLDLFCGAGNFSLPLARAGTDVIGVEASAAAVADARASAAACGLTEARFEATSALHFLRQQGLAGAELVVLDPPRTGAADAVAQLARLRAPRIVYVSCDPATLARDVAVLPAAGYRIGRLQPLDLFPQTPHVETVLEAALAID